MDLAPIEEAIRCTLADRALSRGERGALAGVIAGAGLDERALAVVRARVFEAAREAVDDPRSREVVSWLEDVLKLLAGTRREDCGIAEARFSPGTACRERLSGLIRSAERSADICVFTIADDRITREVRAAHGRGVRVRIVTDDEKAGDPGSDVEALARAGVAVAVDRSPAHMHHKFAIFDDRILATGSYNWTRSAAEQNAENIVVTDDPRLVRAFAAEFDALWERYGR